MRPRRIHIRHYEIEGGTVHVTWRLKIGQSALLPAEKDVIRGVISRGRDFGAEVLAGVIMDNHVHVLFQVGPQRTSTQFVISWKSNSSRLICRDSSRTAPLWQSDFFQRWMRSLTHTATCATYIRNNPQRRWPGIKTYDWLLP